MLVAALKEVEEYDPTLHHNQLRPALWVGHPEYRQDVKDLLRELRQLNALLRDPKTAINSEKVAASASTASFGAKKFVESYFDYMGKGAAVLTIGAVAWLSISLGADKGTVESIWSLLKPGK